MVMILNEQDQVSVPEWVVDLDSFRRWADAGEFPDEGRIFFLRGQVWVDMSKEQVFSHIKVKTRMTSTLDVLVAALQSGLLLGDGLRLTNEAAGLAVKPDATFVAWKTLHRHRVRLIPGTEEGFVELEGSPDMVLEVVSTSSVQKDTEILRQAYWEAGIKEYWLVDARQEPLLFEIWRHTARGYVATRKTNGWLKSMVFGRSFRLTQTTDPLGNPDYTLEAR